MKPNDFVTSPTKGPFHYHVWLELPFPLTIEVNELFFGDYRGIPTEINLSIFSNLFKVVTGSFWQQSREFNEWRLNFQKGEKEELPSTGWIQEYVTKENIYEFVQQLENKKNTRYVHVEEIPAVIHTIAKIPLELIPTEDFNLYDISPQIGFINEELFPILQQVLDVYRIAAYPWLRYSILPISEALIDNALIQFSTGDNKKAGNIHYGFDVRSPRGIGKTRIIQERYEACSQKVSSLQEETQMASVYYLYRMRRWGEAITLASAVVDNLIRDLVAQIASSEIETDAILIAYRYKELFNKVFPAFGKPKLSEVNKSLWDDFVEAKKIRGSRVHGSYAASFDKKEEEETKKHLKAFYDVAKWLRQQMDSAWALDCFDENGESLDAFPI